MAAVKYETRLYAFGSNGAGQLGVGHNDDISAPEPCLFVDVNVENKHHDKGGKADDDAVRTTVQRSWDGRICKIVAGGNHTLLLTGDSKVYVAGKVLGGLRESRSECEDVPSTCFAPVTLPVEGIVTDIAATWEASFLVLDHSRVFAHGTGCKGELGAGDGVVTSEEVQQVFDTKRDTEDGGPIVQISAAMDHVVVLLASGQLWGWGNCRKGQLGQLLVSAKVVWQPVQTQIPFVVNRVTAGRNFTFIVDNEGHSSLFGDRKHFGETVAFSVPTTSNVQAGWSSIYWLTGIQLKASGRDDRGQLPPEELPAIRTFAAGSEHVIACLKDGTVVSWGWGEHGNCGKPVDARGNVAGRFNVIDLAEEGKHTFAGLGAGCASSFVWTTAID